MGGDNILSLRYEKTKQYAISSQNNFLIIKKQVNCKQMIQGTLKKPFIFFFFTLPAMTYGYTKKMTLP